MVPLISLMLYNTVAKVFAVKDKERWLLQQAASDGGIYHGNNSTNNKLTHIIKALLASEVRQLFHRRLYQHKFQNNSGKCLKVRSVSTIKPAFANSENTVGKDMRIIYVRKIMIIKVMDVL